MVLNSEKKEALMQKEERDKCLWGKLGMGRKRQAKRLLHRETFVNGRIPGGLGRGKGRNKEPEGPQ